MWLSQEASLSAVPIACPKLLFLACWPTLEEGVGGGGGRHVTICLKILKEMAVFVSKVSGSRTDEMSLLYILVAEGLVP